MVTYDKWEVNNLTKAQKEENEREMRRKIKTEK